MTDQKLYISSHSTIEEVNLQMIREKKGWVGKFIGDVEMAPLNISLITIILLTLDGLVISIFNFPLHDFWRVVVLPILTLIFGYIFGRSK